MDTSTTQVVQDQQIVYGGFRVRFIALLVNTGFGLLIIPSLFSIYYYFKDGETLGYKVMGLTIKNEVNGLKPKNTSLLVRRILKGGLLLFISVIWFLVSLVFFSLETSGANSESMLVARGLINRILGILSLLFVIPALIYWIPIPFRLNKQGLHDMAAKTLVHNSGTKKVGWMIVGLVLFVVLVILNGLAQGS